MFIKPLFKENQKNMKITTLTITENELEAVFLGLIARCEQATRFTAGDREYNDYWQEQVRHAKTAIQKCQRAYDELEELGDALEQKHGEMDGQTLAALMALKEIVINRLVIVNQSVSEYLDEGKPISKYVGYASGLIDTIAYIEEAAMSYDSELPF